MNGKIVIVDDEPITRMDIRAMLEEADYDVVGEASDGFEAIELCKKHLPELVIMDIQMPILDGLKAGKRIITEQLAGGVLLLTAFSDKQTIEKASSIGALGYLVKPLDEKSLIPMVEVMIAKGKEIRKLEQNLTKLNQKMEERKAIEKAKGILMKENGCTEDEAYQMIRKLSMDRRCPMMEIAATIVISYD
ncbi:ANTAR domain-containing response regulator [Paenibacillus larvae]|uniref:Response regulator-like protein n=3 Tax=Paenibacillus larvae TaxID=1464 RepID=A0A2L1TJD0_9BACL|nr:ANTAR domain-containing response regulator [Paenibacillus larvae]AQR78056.1 response regulator [Paenibacillus larvae subsp. larvae]AQT85911.1 response regulator [Paenibacillus larvae subsp. pulvifaciens]AQZ45852.1 response regulator [Paenibacillus larvae subsp. pulvifaciens]ARF69230.1 response regulator [Paenibacillus larvae subsp. pulvifaciens]AVF20770.1 response regulator-like protein [Paenibacillus larvae subsp. larvae]